MNEIINFIMNGQTGFTPETLIRYMTIVLILTCISSIAESITSNVGGR